MAKENESIFDLSDIPSTEQKVSLRIDSAGIKHNLKVESMEYKEAIGKKSGKPWSAFVITLLDEQGYTHTEMYFKPYDSPAEMEGKKMLKKYSLSEGRLVHTGDCSVTESIKKYNTEFLAFLIDLGEALGHTHAAVQDYLIKHATSFKSLCEAFISKFRPSDETRISAKLLWNNNDNGKVSNLEIHGSYPAYYPFGNDFFDIYQPERPTVLQISEYEFKHKMQKKYTGQSDAPKNDDVIQRGSRPTVPNPGDDDLPF